MVFFSLLLGASEVDRLKFKDLNFGKKRQSIYMQLQGHWYIIYNHSMLCTEAEEPESWIDR